MQPLAATESFALLESLRFEPRTGYVLLPKHLDRLERTASHFGFRCPGNEVKAALIRQAAQLVVPAKVRLLVDAHGRISTQAGVIGSVAPVRVALAHAPIDPADPFLQHKTTRRIVYEQALEGRGDADDVLLRNPSGAVTEASSSNIVFRLGTDLLSPPVSEGLLASTFVTRSFDPASSGNVRSASRISLERRRSISSTRCGAGGGRITFRRKLSSA